MGWKILPVSVLLLVAAVQCERTPECELRVARTEWSAYACIPVDADTNGVDELYWVDDWTQRLDDLSSRVLEQNMTWVPSRARQVMVLAIPDGGDAVPRLLFAVGDPDSLYVVYGTSHLTVQRTSWPSDRTGRWDAFWGRATSADLNRDGSPDALLSVSAGYSARLTGRAVYAVNLAEDGVLWRYNLGPGVADLVAEDLNGDGRMEILVGTSAVHNGVSANGTSDTNSYVICLNDSGRVIWQRPIRFSCSGTKARVAVADIDGNGSRDIVVADTRSVAGDAIGSILVLDPLDGHVLRSCISDVSDAGFLVDDLDGDGRSEIVIAGDSVVRLLDGDFEVHRTHVVAGGVQRLCASGSLLGRPDRQLVLLTRSGRVVVLDRYLRLLAEHEYSRRVESVRPVSAGEGRLMSLLVDIDPVTPEGPQRSYQLLTVAVLPRQFLDRVGSALISFLRTPWGYATMGFVLLLLLVTPAALYARASYREFTRYVTRGMVERAGIVMFSRGGRVTSINKRATELLALPQGVRARSLDALLARPEFAPLRTEQSKIKEGKLRRVVADVALEVDGVQRTFRAALSRLRLGGFLLSLEDLAAVEYARRVAAWGPVAQRLAHGIKTPLSTIRLTAQTMEEKDPAGSKVIEEEVDRLAKMTDGFMRLADFEPPRLEAKDINAVVQRVLDELGVASLHGIELKTNLAEGLPAVQLDEEQVVRALGNLVNNAIQAMQGKGRLAVATRKADSAAEVVIAVADSGPGIPPDYLAKLFQPFFTRKAGGTGLGLTIVRKVAEDHGGRVEVESEPGKGATFRFILPVPKPVA